MTSKRSGDQSFLFLWRVAIRECDLPPAARLVLLTMSSYMNSDGGSARPGSLALAAGTGFTRSTVVRWRVGLVELGWLAVTGKWKTTMVYKASIPRGHRTGWADLSEERRAALIDSRPVRLPDRSGSRTGLVAGRDRSGSQTPTGLVAGHEVVNEDDKKKKTPLAADAAEEVSVPAPASSGGSGTLIERCWEALQTKPIAPGKKTVAEIVARAKASGHDDDDIVKTFSMMTFLTERAYDTVLAMSKRQNGKAPRPLITAENTEDYQL